MPRKEFFDKFASKLDSMDPGSIHSYVNLLSREHGFMESVFNAIREGIIVMDDRLRIAYHNDVAREMFGIPPDHSRLRMNTLIRGIDWKRFFLPGEEGVSSYHEVEILYPKRRILSFYAVPRQETLEEDKAFVTLIFNDITGTFDRLNSEAETKRTELITTLAAEVAHEIGNPLNSLYINLQLLLKSLNNGKFEEEEGKIMIQESKNEVERLDTIIHQFLHALRPAKPVFQSVDLKTALLESLTFMRHEIEGKNVTVNCLWSDTLPRISGDIDLLKQAFYNLVKNAVQAMEQGGALVISCSADDRWVFITVADEGKGIKPEDVSNLFKPFFTTKEKGNGLGLMVVERIIRDHGGRLSFESKVGEGTCFHLALPREDARIRVLPPPKEMRGIPERTGNNERK